MFMKKKKSSQKKSGKGHETPEVAAQPLEDVEVNQIKEPEKQPEMTPEDFEEKEIPEDAESVETEPEVKDAPDDTHAILKEIYEDKASEQKADMGKLDQHKRRLRKWAVLFVVLVALGVAGLRYWNTKTVPPRQESSSVDLSIDAPKDIKSGEEFSFEVGYANVDRVKLQDLVLTIRYPEGFTFMASDVSSSEKQNVWNLGVLDVGVSGSVQITGVVIGEINNAKKISATLTYVPDNFRSQFETTATADIVIIDSLIQLDVVAPVSVAANQSFATTVTYTNTSAQPLDNIKIEADLPLDYVLENSKPVADRQAWVTNRLEANAENTIVLNGTLNTDVGENRQLIFTLSMQDADGQYRKQVTTSVLVLVVDTQLQLNLETVIPQDRMALLGDKIEYKVSYENTSDTRVTDVVLEVEFDNSDGLLVAKNQQVDGELAESEKGIKITFDKKVNEDLSELLPGDKGSTTFTLATEKTVPSDFDHTDVSLSATATVTSLMLDSGSTVTGKHYESSPLVVKFSSVADLLQEARYYDDQSLAVGTGPLPAVASQRTTFRVFWYATTTTSAVENVTVTASLPESVFWVGTTSANAGSTVTFDVDTRVVRWVIESVPAHSGTANVGLDASFDVAVTPTANDVGKVLTLVNKATIEGTDAFTDKLLEDSAALQTTLLETDPVYNGDGKIQ